MAIEFRVRLSQREAEAVLRSDGFSNGRGVRLSQALQMAQMKIIGAIVSAASKTPAVVSPREGTENA